jgi:N-acetylglutamate synthase-like GNAT family acetyltransferase
MFNMPPNITKFLNNHAHNEWLKSEKMDVYVRKGHHLIDGEIRSCFDVANISVPEKLRGHGIFTKWLEQVEKKILPFGIEYVFVESILELRLVSFLNSRGYKEIPGSNPPSMCKRPS